MKTVTVEKRTITPRQNTKRQRPETREEKMIASLSPHLNLMVRAVRKAGRSMVRDFGEISSLQVSLKGPGDFVSNADTFAEKTLINELLADRPDYGVLSEECGCLAPKNGCTLHWVIDPIDGTTNFLHALPTFSISVALMDKDEITAGVIFNPITNELYYAEKGKGAFVMTPTGNTRLRVSGRNKLAYALVCSNGFSNKKNRQMIENISGQIASVRFNGSTTLGLAGVAAGQYDAYISAQFKLWDIATGYLLIKEAGGYISDMDNNTDLMAIVNHQTLVASNTLLKEAITKKVRGK